MAQRPTKQLANRSALIADGAITVSVYLTPAELRAIARAAFVVTSGGESRVINAADNAIRKLREAAAGKVEQI